MSEKKKRPGWLQKLEKLMKSSDRSDKKDLKKTLEKLKHKANFLKAEIDHTHDEEERARLQEKLALINKHRKKGIKRLEQMKKDSK